MAKIAMKKAPGISRKSKLKLWNVFVDTLAILVFAGAFGWHQVFILRKKKESDF